MTVNEIKEAVCGRDSNGKSKVVSMMGAHIYDLDDEMKDPEVIMESSSIEPSALLRVHGNFATIDLEFDSGKSEFLSMFYRCLERYLEETDNNTEHQETTAFLTLIPYALGGQYYVTAVNPIFWALEPDSVGGEQRKLRVVFYADDVVFNEADLEEGENILDAMMAQTVQEEKDETDSELYNYIDSSDTASDDYLSLGEERDYEFNNPDKYIKSLNEDDPYAD